MAKSSQSAKSSGTARGSSPLAKATGLPPSPVVLIAEVKEQLKELIGHGVENIAEFSETENGWALTATVVELSRIPASTDVLAEYVVDLNSSGTITSYRRGRRFYRGEVGEVE